MDVTLTVRAEPSGNCADVRITGPDDSSALRLAAALRAVVGAPADAVLSVDGAEVVSDGSAADCGLSAGTVVTIGAGRAATPAADSELVVSCGPDAARSQRLSPGRHVIGRDPACALSLADRRVSRRHLLVTVTAGKATVCDLDSANGSWLNGEPLVAAVPVDLPIGSALRIGDSEIRVTPALAREGRHGPAWSRRVIHRSPRLIVQPATEEIHYPPPPPTPTPTRLPILAAVTPLVAGIALSVFLHQWQFLAFTALSPIMIAGQAANDRWSSRRASRAANREFVTATAHADQQLEAALARERIRRHDEAPDLAQLRTAAREPGRILWHRCAAHPDALQLRLGRGNLPSRVTVHGHPPATVADVPVCVSLSSVGILGICGPRDLRAGLGRALVIQAATLHSPADLRIVVLAPGRSAEWCFARWLPHVTADDGSRGAQVGFDDEQVAARLRELAERADHTVTGRTLIVIDATVATRASPSMTELLERPGARTSVVWLAEESDLPGACRAVATVAADPDVGLTLTHDGGAGPLCAVPDLLADDLAEQTARSLAPLLPEAASDSRGLPRTLRWSAVAGLGLGDHAAAARSMLQRWEAGASGRITLGRGIDGDVAVDLWRDGPHALIAGTTGAGKSELLLSLVASLAAGNRPDQVSLLLIDHKGGAALGQCTRLPHVVGLVTDLDRASTQRALGSLTAELRRRESLFAAAGVSDVTTYRGTDPLPRLVIVVDEFAALTEEQPDFVGGLVGIAQRGRSLGVHLVLATQRPDGVVSADIRANTRLRICLGVAREHESRDVIDCPDAAAISRATPGRAYLRVGPGDLRLFQTALVGCPTTSATELAVQLSPLTTLGDPPAVPVRSAVNTQERTDLDALIDAAVAASEQLSCTPPAPPWLPPLPDQLTLSELRRTIGAGQVGAWGLVDLPSQSRQDPLVVDVEAAGTTLIAGTARSGRSSAALSIAMAAAGFVGPDRLHLWGIDGGSGLAALAALPHCGAVMSAHDTDRIDALIGQLSEEVARRRRQPAPGAPTLMLVIDGWEGVVNAQDERDAARFADGLHRLLVEGQSAGLHTVITGDRGILTGRLSSVAVEKVVLRLADRADITLIGMSGRDLPERLPAGRGVRASDLALVQIGLPDPEATEIATSWPPPNPPVRRFAPLPPRISLAGVRDLEPAQSDRIVLGLGADDLEPVGLRRADMRTGLLVTGPPGSGRSTALLVLAQQLTGRHVAVSCAPSSPLATLTDVIRLPRDDQDHALAIVESLQAGPGLPPDLLVDDVDQLPDGALWNRLEALIRDGPDGDRVIALSGTTDSAIAAFRGPLCQLRRTRVGVLLRPASPHDGDLIGLQLPRRRPEADPPGRGWFVDHNRSVRLRLQVADPTSEPAKPHDLAQINAFRGANG